MLHYKVFDMANSPEFPAFLLDDIIFGKVPGSNIVYEDGYNWMETIDSYEDERSGVYRDNIGAAAQRLLFVVREAFQKAPGKSVILNFEDRLREATADHRIVTKGDVELFINNLRTHLIERVGVPGMGKESDLNLLINVYGLIEKDAAKTQNKSLIGRVVSALPIGKSRQSLPSLDDCYEAITAAGHLITNEVEMYRAEMSDERVSSIKETITRVANHIGNDLDFDYEAARLREVSVKLDDIVSERSYKVSGPSI
jgi:hypothetical protein